MFYKNVLGNPVKVTAFKRKFQVYAYTFTIMVKIFKDIEKFNISE